MSIVVIAIVALGAFVLLSKLRRPPPAPQAAAPGQPQTVYVQNAQPKFFDLFVEDKREREAELERQRLRATLDAISGIVGPEPKPPAAPPQPPNP